MQNIHDVGLRQNAVEGMPTIDPLLLQQQSRGLAAGSELAGINQSAAMAEALRKSGAELPGMTGRGYSAAGPNLLNGIVQMMNKREGRNELKAMESQANALRGEAEAGQQASLQADAQQNQINRAQQMEMAQLASAERQKMEQLRQTRMKQMPKPYVNNDGDIKYLSYEQGKGLVDEHGALADSEGYLPYKDSSLAKKYGSDFKGLGSPQRKTIIDADFGINQLNKVNALANEMSQDEWSQLNKAGRDVLAKKIAPKDFNEYINKNMRGLSPRVKRYMTRLNEFSSDIRNKRFGSALTIGETELAEMFLPSAVGINLADRTDRVNLFADRFKSQVESVDRMTGTTFGDRLTQYVPFKPSESAATAAMKPNTGFRSKAHEKLYEEERADNERYKKLTGKDMDSWAETEELYGPKKAKTNRRGRMKSAAIARREKLKADAAEYEGENDDS